ncbi:hypothetical protein chiPu_0027696, partial [Chiloscyllium punctatum]|nr:hypothetical protein [Chiloscyllium punctatum]
MNSHNIRSESVKEPSSNVTGLATFDSTVCHNNRGNPLRDWKRCA